ncbi:MAG: TRAM domain-containing protein [Verrucomicrobiae bacterium]|nr:TRAM domain-containing protein [Verrucomicrobiae bacterium]
MTAPNLQPGQRIELDISTIAFGGDGIGRIEDFVVFVPFVVEGERVEAEIVEVKRRYALADLVRVITPSPHRVEPRCPYYANCAGCQYQHIAYGHQLELKLAQIRDVLLRIGGIVEPPVEPVVPSPRQYGYRNKIVVHGPGAPGFWTLRGRSIVEVQNCAIARDEINLELLALSRKVSALNKHLTLRCDSAGRVWTFEEPAPDQSIEEELLGRRLQVPLGSFFQVNREIIALLAQHVREAFARSSSKTLVDAYCGVGLFALLLGDLAARVYGIELDQRAIAAANANAVRMGFAHCDFYAGSADRLLRYTLRQCKLEETCLILDPPRSGCSRAVLNTLFEYHPRLVLYVSCAPPMLARDLKQLLSHGYKLERVTPFDMFPQTKHCEVIAHLHWMATSS